MKFCTECGTQMNDDSKFCPACGTAAAEYKNQNSASVPTFTPPPQEAPVFTQPPQETPVFTPPPQETPVFTAPSQDAPVFTAPSQDAPIFTPPNQDVPIFTPPGQEGSAGACCHHHKTDQAVTTCARCGKYMCQDCVETYGVSIGEYAGQPLCYDCTVEMVSNNIAELEKNKKTIKTMFIATGIGMIIGAIVGMAGGPLGAFLGAMIGGSFWTFFKNCLVNFKDALVDFWKTDGDSAFGFMFAFFRVMFGFLWQAVASVYRTIKKIIYYRKYLKETSGFIASDTQALQNMQDYMEYTQVRSMNQGVDLATLMSEGGQLRNNSYAQSVAANGEATADAHLRQCVTTIAENGEIIRSFAA